MYLDQDLGLQDHDFGHPVCWHSPNSSLWPSKVGFVGTFRWTSSALWGTVSTFPTRYYHQLTCQPFCSFWLLGRQYFMTFLADKIWHSHRGSGYLWFPISTGLRVVFHFRWQSYPRKPWEGVHKKRFWPFHGLQSLNNDQANKAADGCKADFGRKMVKLTQNTLQKEVTYKGSPFWQNTKSLFNDGCFHMSQLLSHSASSVTELIALNGTFVFQACLLSEAQEFAMNFSCLLSKTGDKNAPCHFSSNECMEKWDEDF